MNSYLNSTDAINALHGKGFANDFQVSGNDLLWVQGHSFVRVGEFAILEYYMIQSPKNHMTRLVVFGIVATHHNIKGILLRHYKSYTNITTPILLKKIKEMNIHACNPN